MPSPAVDPTRLKDSLQALVGFNTENPPGHESAAATYIADRLRGCGFGVETADVLPGRTNVVARLDNGPGPVFAFNTHIDTVPAGDGWDSDPFKLRPADGRLYGRGACDAKGPLAAMLEAMRLLCEGRSRWSGTLLGVFVADEEVASLGAKEYVKTGPVIDFCLIGEPTSCTAVTAHKGSLRPVVRVAGKSAHSGTPDKGVNAILKSVPLLQLVAEEHERVRTRVHPLVGQASLTVTRANGGRADNVVPDACDFLLDRRMVPGETEEETKAALAALVRRAAQQSDTDMTIVEFRPTTGGATETAPDHPVVIAAQEACTRHNGRPSPLGGFEGGCDLVHFRSVGAHGVVVGPGSLAVAHKPNEFVPEDELVRAALIYHDIVAHMMGA
ncbi:M20 family metallopeptidase [Shumkonia mesophila]|uniref:M20 family metallopeptidase n=1 Tax=Shumkonia mesophila TaxID=2838854 RepID=UPI002934E356|nr:M20 family metallopeptidase [Shumkonia mesophila]